MRLGDQIQQASPGHRVGVVRAELPVDESHDEVLIDEKQPVRRVLSHRAENCFGFQPCLLG